MAREITYPAGMTKRARFIDGAAGFRILAIRDAKKLLTMTDAEIITDREARGIPAILGMSLDSERFYAEQTIAKGFRMQDVRDYAAEIMAEH